MFIPDHRDPYYWHPNPIATAIVTANAVADADRAARYQAQVAAQAQANAAIMAQAAQNSAALNARSAIIGSIQMHLSAAQAAVATNPDAAGHLAAASQLLGQLA